MKREMEDEERKCRNYRQRRSIFWCIINYLESHLTHFHFMRFQLHFDQLNFHVFFFSLVYVFNIHLKAILYPFHNLPFLVYSIEFIKPNNVVCIVHLYISIYLCMYAWNVLCAFILLFFHRFTNWIWRIQ